MMASTSAWLILQPTCILPRELQCGLGVTEIVFPFHPGNKALTKLKVGQINLNTRFMGQEIFAMRYKKQEERAREGSKLMQDE